MLHLRLLHEFVNLRLLPSLFEIKKQGSSRQLFHLVFLSGGYEMLQMLSEKKKTIFR